ncbi:bifunctional phosphoribosyl-AMP cyclohydrolase/phosphoribosyl-ATP diphosphatase HisIE [Domibacillus sp. A3M-37]|uniref:bifunctional phosphoribosyl-AMP cyclohydrolase/phosphoribosyl-ATP diphosphatase HisIE n=1 Tax=Domibacillus TaxID=1433999 RepID=UPI0020B68B04|nr:bifunctional phosphoribosyl-AMP cyclohydrolase/phosphoribosyl-ATP diphosphatase HisIE [Domibacillus sp. A3M-37]MCP3761145.1 bifunctional phosphoribosyl-AMP cyclohydrolase/phosphoribosyl-ATP diphosphatase HisIE [Domibacillus sp. A3M-37]
MIDEVKFDEKGLVPAIVQDATTYEVLTLAYMNKDSLQKTMETGETWFYSRSREELWHKGATSGNTQKVISMQFDCDKDAIVVKVEPAGPACHRDTTSCFDEPFYGEDNGSLPYSILQQLEQVIADREQNRPEGAYTTYLFEKGVDKILKKVGEEAAEVIIAAKNRDKEELQWEAADLLYHLLVLLREQDLALDDVLSVLARRHEGKGKE